MNNSGMELNAVLHAPGVPEKKDLLVKKGDVFKNSQDGSHVVVERVSQGEDGPIIYSSQDGSRDRRILGRPLKNFLVDVGVRDMESIDPIQNREPVFYEAYENQMEILGNAFSREFFACEKALDEWEASLKGKSKTTLTAQLMIGLNRQKMDEIANEWEKTDDRLVRGGRRRMALLAEIRDFSQRQIAEDLLERKNEVLVSLKGEYGTDEPDGLLIERGYFRDVLHAKVEHLLGKCRRVKSGKLKMSDEVISLTKFECEVKRLNDSIVGYESGDVDRESTVVEIKNVLDALAEMDRVAFHQLVDDEKGNGTHTKEKKSIHRMKKNESEDPARKKLKGEKGGPGKKERSRRIDKRTIIGGDDSLVAIPPTIQENGVQLEGSSAGTPIVENVSAQSMKINPGESIPAKPNPEKSQEVSVAFKEVVATAQKNSQKPEHVSSAPEKNIALRNGNEGPTDKQAMKELYLSETAATIEGARDIESLISLTAKVTSKIRPGEHISLALRPGLAALLDKTDGDAGFKKRFNDLKVAWGKQMVKLVFDASPTGKTKFFSMLKSAVSQSSVDANASGATHACAYQYLTERGLNPDDLYSFNSFRVGVRGVIRDWERAVEIFRGTERKADTRETPQDRLNAFMGVIKKRRVPFENKGRKTTLAIEDDGQLSFVSTKAGEQDKRGTVKLSADTLPIFLKSFEKEMGFSFPFPKRRERNAVKVPSGKNEPVADMASPVVEAVMSNPENIFPRTYDELFKEADDGPYHGILFGAAAAGFLTMKEGAQKESVDLKVYDKDHPGEILEALIDGMKDSFHRVGKKLGWSESETNIYARGLVQKSIEKYLK
ncbi:MAG: hypothetical protein KA034_01185 [Candidatus Moranbacteria bacterium]|nr:hypothetical protein [Candidatus Moranbacteria bacterium]